MIKILCDTIKTSNLTFKPNFIFKWFTVSLILHLVLAWFSLGFYNFDEHFQILEFAGYKAGLINASSLTWEYGAQIRATFQPYFAWCIIKLLESLHCYDPFLTATVLRFISAVLGWAASFLVSLVGLNYIENARLRKFFIIISSVLAPLIFVHVRFSSEGWSGSLAFAGMAVAMLLIQKKDRETRAGTIALFLLSGFLMGLAYICRFQSVIVVFVFMLWLLFIAKLSLKNLSWISLGIMAAILAGFLLDRLFYGVWVNTAYRYFDVNIIKGVAAKFGTEPWWWYIKEAANSNFFYLQIPMMLLVAIALVTKLKNPFVCISIAFIAVHFAIGHKEIRFLFVLVDALPLLLVLGLGSLAYFFSLKGIIYKTGISIIVLLFIVINTISFLNSCFWPSSAYLYPMQYIYRNYHQPVDIVLSDPYVNMFTHGTLKMNFYERPEAHFIYLDINRIDSIFEIAKNDKRPLLVMEWQQGFDQKKSLGSLYPYLLPEYIQFPSWLQALDLNHWEERTSSWHVYRIKT